MKRSILVAAVVGLTATIQPTLAQPTRAPDSASPVQPQVPSPAEFDKRLAQVQDHMKQMQAQMDKIAATQDPQERQRLPQEHWASMRRRCRQTMWSRGELLRRRPAWAGNDDGRADDGVGSHAGDYSSLTPEQLKQRQYMMDQYLPMQQMMTDQMMWHQLWMNPQPPAVTK